MISNRSSEADPDISISDHDNAANDQRFRHNEQTMDKLNPGKQSKLQASVADKQDGSAPAEIKLEAGKKYGTSLNTIDQPEEHSEAMKQSKSLNLSVDMLEV